MFSFSATTRTATPAWLGKLLHMHTIFVDNLDAIVAQITKRGLHPAERDSYENGVRKITYRDPDGNEIGFGGAPL